MKSTTSRSRLVTSPNVSGLYGLLLERFDSLIFELHHPLQDFTGTKMSNDQEKALRHAYMSMKEKLLKYEMQVRRKPMFPIATALDPRFKLEHIPHGEQKFVTETLLNLLKSVSVIEGSSSMPIDDRLASRTHKRSKVKMQFMERQSSRSTSVDEQSVKVELDDYLCEPCIDCLCDDSLQWWHKRGSNKHLRLSVLIKEFLSICASRSPSERLFSTGRGIITFR